MENRTKPGMMTNFWGLFRSRPDMSQAAKSGTPVMEGYRPTIPRSVPPSAATPGALGTNEVSISNPGSDSEIDKGKEVRANPGGAEAAPATPAPAAENAAKAADPNVAAKQASMTPAQQKKEYQKQLKQQQDAVKKSQGDRKKKEAELQQKVKEQKKKSKAKQDEQKQEQKQPPPAPTGGQAPIPPVKP
jgi:hypothetical protein